MDDTLILADEVLTPDSSRFWPRETYKPGGPQPSYDKQYVRDYLESIHWNKQPPAPALPAEVAAKTGEKYRRGVPRADRKTALNWLDIVLLLMFCLSVVGGFAKGFAKLVIGLAGRHPRVFCCGLWFYGTAGGVPAALREPRGSRQLHRIPGDLPRRPAARGA